MSNLCLNNNVLTKLILILIIRSVQRPYFKCMKTFIACIIAFLFDEHLGFLTSSLKEMKMQKIPYIPREVV